jgi:ribosomal protein S18 acetylase RimI-like enzyme
MKRSLTGSDLLRLADLNLVEFWCQTAKCVPDTEILEYQDSVFINSGLEFSGHSFAFNLALDTNESPGDFLARAKAFFAERKPMFSLQLRAHADQSLIQYCKDNKVLLMSEAPGMALDEPVKGSKPPSEASLNWVEDKRGVKDFKNVVAEAFQDLGLSRGITESYFVEFERVLNPYTVMVVAYLKGKPAGAAMAMLSHGIGGVYWVGTTKKARGMGLGEYCTREVSNAAFDLGARKVVLQASKFGEPVYRKIGYREITRYPWFICSSK